MEVQGGSFCKIATKNRMRSISMMNGEGTSYCQVDSPKGVQYSGWLNHQSTVKNYVMGKYRRRLFKLNGWYKPSKCWWLDVVCYCCTNINATTPRMWFFIVYCRGGSPSPMRVGYWQQVAIRWQMQSKIILGIKKVIASGWILLWSLNIANWWTWPHW